LIDEYRSGDAAQAVRQFAGWPRDRLLREAVGAFDRSDPRRAAAIAMLHLEAGLITDSFGNPDITFALLTTPDRTGEPHYRLSYPLIASLDSFAREKKDTELQAFCRNWWIATVSAIMRRDNFDGWIGMVPPQALADPEISLLHGAVFEKGMGPETFDGPIGLGLEMPGVTRTPQRVSTPFGVFDANGFRDAERDFRRALSLNPSLIEGHLRLGHILYLFNRKQEAEKELRETESEAIGRHDTFTSYLGNLMLGDIAESNSRPVDAVAAYRRAVDASPDGYVGRLALGQALIMTGKADEGWTTMRSVFGAPGRLRVNERDPWSLYGAAQYRQLDARLAAMREYVQVRHPPPDGVPSGPSAALLSFAGSPPATNVAIRRLADDSQAFRASANAVRLDVLVRDGTRVITGLTANDFDLLDKGVPQRVQAVASPNALSIALVLDTSESMSKKSWPLAVAGANAVISGLRPGDSTSVVAVSDRFTLLADREHDVPSLRRVLADVHPEPLTKTAIWDGVLTAGSLVSSSADRALVMVVTDGADNVSWFDRSRVIDRLRRNGLPIDGIEVSFDSHTHDWTVGSIGLQQLRATLGSSVFDATASDLGDQVARRLDEQRQSYVLMYEPHGVRRDDGWHEIKVRLKNGRRGSVVVRPGYYADTSASLR